MDILLISNTILCLAGIAIAIGPQTVFLLNIHK